MKKSIIVIIIVLLGVVAFAIGMFLQQTVIADTVEKQEGIVILETLKVGKYYLENGTEKDYIEVFNDGTIQVNIDYIECIKTAFPGMLENASEEDYELYMRAYAEDQEFWDTRHYYTLSESIRAIGFSDKPNSKHTGGRILRYEDENTIILSKDSGYIYHYQE